MLQGNHIGLFVMNRQRPYNRMVNTQNLSISFAFGISKVFFKVCSEVF